MKQAFVDRVNREMAADFPAADLPPREALAQACRFLLQPSIVRGTFAYWNRATS